MIWAEKSLLGCMMMAPEDCEGVYGRVRPEMFENEALARMFGCCQELRKKGLRADATTLIETLGEEYKALVLECAETAPGLAGFESYIACLREGWRERAILTGLDELRISGMDASGLTRALGQLWQSQQALEEAEGERTAKDWKEGMGDFLGWLGADRPALATGFAGLDRLTGGLPQRGVTAISARPGGGKTSFALQIATQVSKGRRVLYQSLEMPREQLYTCIFARALGLDSALFRDRALTPAQRQRVAQAARLLEEKYSLIIDDRDCAGLQQLEANILRFKPQVVVVDHLGLLTPHKARSQRNEELAGLTRGLKQLAMKRRVAVVELVQAGRSSEGRPMTMGDMFGSATIEQDADLLIGLEAEDPGPGGQGRARARVLKNRAGALGCVEFYWRRRYHQFMEVQARGEQPRPERKGKS